MLRHNEVYIQRRGGISLRAPLGQRILQSSAGKYRATLQGTRTNVEDTVSVGHVRTNKDTDARCVGSGTFLLEGASFERCGTRLRTNPLLSSESNIALHTFVDP